ncbi:hypothetical protein W824_05285 [Clavibacter cf. michiganensis LMG 26808]|nr:hypothetical protein W824_05285 [Clavibacter cf. michiganensis LMG 26808]
MLSSLLPCGVVLMLVPVVPRASVPRAVVRQAVVQKAA